MHVLNALLTLALLILGVVEWRAARRYRAGVEQLRCSDLAQTDPTLRRATADYYEHRYLGGTR